MRLLLKVSFIVVALGATGLGLLALRQQRYEVSNQISRAHNRVIDQERAIWKMQAEVASRTDPRDIRDAATKLGMELEPVQPAGSEGIADAGAERTSVTPPTPASPADKAAAPGTKPVAKPKQPSTPPASAKKKKPARKDAAPAPRKDATHAAH